MTFDTAIAGWTSSDLPDLLGHRVVVTGGTSGLGLVTARELARAGATVVLTGRSPERGRAAVARITASAPQAQVSFAVLDLADLASVRAFALAGDEPLDLLVNNAGVMAIPRTLTPDGFEAQLGTNHLGHFALTGLLIPRLLGAARPRVVTVSSSAHRMGRIEFEDLMGERHYRRWRAYGQSKLANLLFSAELQRRADRAHVPLISVAAHPGYADTNLQSVGPAMSGSTLAGRGAAWANRLLAQSADDGAIPQLYAATADDVEPGGYYGPSGFREQRGRHPKRVPTSPAAADPQTAARLWSQSKRLTGVDYRQLEGA
ncbi:MAG: oxidoreductase [Actinomycetes bacterium]